MIDAPTVGLIAHVDTTPDTPGTGVAPIVHRSWAGDRSGLPGDPSPGARPGGDACARRQARARSRHERRDDAARGRRQGGSGGDHDRRRPSRSATTRRARPPGSRSPSTRRSARGRITSTSTRSAPTSPTRSTGRASARSRRSRSRPTSFRLTIKGVGVHPGTAKGRLVNAVKLVADVVAALPRDGLSPETTEGREGYVHPMRLAGGTAEATVWFIARDHDDDRLEEHVDVVRRLATEIVGREPRASFTLDVEEQYRNMRKVLDRHPEIVARRRGGDPAGRRRARPHHHPRRDRRRATDGEGPADAQPLHRWAALPLAARVGLAPGHGRSRGDVRRAREGSGASSASRAG